MRCFPRELYGFRKEMTSLCGIAIDSQDIFMLSENFLFLGFIFG